VRRRERHKVVRNSTFLQSDDKRAGDDAAGIRAVSLGPDRPYGHALRRRQCSVQGHQRGTYRRKRKVPPLAALVEAYRLKFAALQPPAQDRAALERYVQSLKQEHGLINRTITSGSSEALTTLIQEAAKARASAAIALGAEKCGQL
jgi:hypothetical protein